MPTLTAHSQPSIKVIGTNGQISLGKKFAGRQVLVEDLEDGVWLVRTATVTPDNEKWLHSPTGSADLTSALNYANANPPTDNNVDATIEKLSGNND